MGNVVADVTRLWPKRMIPFDFNATFDLYKPPFDLSAAVGVGGANRNADVVKVQTFLNRFIPGAAGPGPPLEVDGWVGPKTVAAIRAFQMAQFGWHDDRVDPGGPTLIELTVDEVDPTQDREKGIIINAVHEWNKQLAANIRWVKRTQRDANYVLFEPGGRNASETLGMKGDRQLMRINLSKAQSLTRQFGGTSRGVIIHEMGHAAGLGHEHSRSDRDRFVRIDRSNIDPGRECDFTIPPDPNCPKLTVCRPQGGTTLPQRCITLPLRGRRTAPGR